MQFNNNGFVVLEDLLTSEECDSLRVRCRELIDEFDLSTHPKSVFSTTNQVCAIESQFTKFHKIGKIIIRRGFNYQMQEELYFSTA